LCWLNRTTSGATTLPRRLRDCAGRLSGMFRLRTEKRPQEERLSRRAASAAPAAGQSQKRPHHRDRVVFGRAVRGRRNRKDQTLDLIALSLVKAIGLTIRGIAGLIP
jgi:hypothetical protein